MSSPVSGRSLELYYIDGRPDGMLTAEMFNWTGHVLMAPRPQIVEALTRPEAGYVGAYLLIGEQEGSPTVYIGEGEDIGARIRSHDVGKHWWTSAILVTTAGNKLNKAHVRYIEARLLEEATKIGRARLANEISPARPGLSEADVAKMEVFLENLLFALPALRVDIFIQRTRPEALTRALKDVARRRGTRFQLRIKKDGLAAQAVLRDGEFIVEAGSQARAVWQGIGTEETGYAQLHGELLRTGVLISKEGHAVFKENYAFKSSSAAASVVTGRPSNGTIEWKTEGGVTYREWEAQRLGDLSGDQT